MRFQTLALLPVFFSTASSYTDPLYSRGINDQGLTFQHRAAITEAYANAYADAYDSAHVAIQARWLNEAGIHRRYPGPPSPFTTVKKQKSFIIYEDPKTVIKGPTKQDPPYSSSRFEEELEPNARYKKNPETEHNRRPGK